MISETKFANCYDCIWQSNVYRHTERMNVADNSSDDAPYLLAAPVKGSRQRFGRNFYLIKHGHFLGVWRTEKFLGASTVISRERVILPRLVCQFLERLLPIGSQQRPVVLPLRERGRQIADPIATLHSYE
jgi:hypothetical protein